MVNIYINEKWYDVSTFVNKHPGGSVISYYENQDATQVFQEFHRRSNIAGKLLTSLPTITDNFKFPSSVIVDDFQRWANLLESNGYFKPSIQHVCYRVFELIVIFSLASLVLYIGWTLSSMILYGIFSGRCGWVQHEAGHRSFTGIIKYDNIIQKITIGFGLLTSANMWNSMHNKHHATTQKVGYDIDLDTMPLVAFNKVFLKSNKVYKLLRYQAYTFLPITSGFFVMLFWIFYLHPRKIIRDRDYTQAIMTLSGHIIRSFIIKSITGWSLLSSYFMLMGTMYIAGIYLFGHFSLSHTFTPVVEKNENPNWIQYSLEHTVDINTKNPLVSWIMGYLNCQCVHHLFPQMPQFRQPEVSKQLAIFAKKWNIKYSQLGYFECWKRMLSNLDQVGKNY